MKRQTCQRLAFLLLLWFSFSTRAGGAENHALSQDVYVWQRDWNEPVRNAVAEHGAHFKTLVALAAEVSWRKQQPDCIQVPLDFSALKSLSENSERCCFQTDSKTSKSRVGLALRIGPYPGPFLPDDRAINYLADLAAALVREAQSNGCAPDELQIDFDSADSKLDGYRIWVKAIQKRIAPVPLIITALPDWLNQPAFAKLVAATDGFILQVHSLHAPKSADAPFVLCDPAEARRAADRAGRLNIPFRVALPTYGYVIAFDRYGKFAGLSADGPRKNWPADYQMREVRTDPAAMAQLVGFWSTNHPASMQGIIWYRLPMADDFLNLRWPTLAATMTGRAPREHIQAAARRNEPGLVEISLENDGELDFTSRLAVEVRWHDARLVAGDGIGGFNLVDDGISAMKFQMDDNTFRLPAGEKRIIGWLRLSEDREVQIEIKTY